MPHGLRPLVLSSFGSANGCQPAGQTRDRCRMGGVILRLRRKNNNYVDNNEHNNMNNNNDTHQTDNTNINNKIIDHSNYKNSAVRKP